MRITIHAVGRMKSGAERELVTRYLERFSRIAPQVGLEFLSLREVPESRAQSASQRKVDEAAPLLAAVQDGAYLVLLDENGKSLGSEKFAAHLGSMRDNGTRDIIMAIGGPDGHSPELLRQAGLTLSFGQMTWPHQIARILLGEQLYRAATILSGHPYHRS